MITTTYNYTSGSGFLYDPTKIGFVSSMAQLVLANQAGDTYVPAIGSSTYNPSYLTYSGSTLEQVDQRPSTATFYAAWTSQLNANWSGTPSGSLVVTAFGTAAIDSGGLDLTGYNSATYATISTANNIDTTGSGTIEFQVTPNYSGTPSNLQQFLSVSAGQSSVNNLINIFQNGGSLDLQVHNSGGGIAINTGAPWSPVAGTTYTFTLQYASGATTLFINGVSFLTSAATYVRTASGYCAVGSSYLGAGGQPNFWIKNFAWYSTVVTPASAVLAPSIYAGATANLPEFTYAGTGSVQAYTAFTTTDFGGLVYTLNGLYWNGSAWVSSNGTFAQANTQSIVNTNIAALPASNTLQINAIFNASNSPQMGISALTATYIGQAYSTSNPYIAPNSPLTMDSLASFSDVESETGSDAIGWYLMIGSTPMWWNGSAWVISNATYSQSNSATVININASTLPISSGAYVTPYALLHSAAGTSTPMLTSLTLMYDYFGPEPIGPGVCLVYGYILDEKNIPIVGATVSATNPTTFENAGIVVAQGVRSTTTDSLGYFSLNLLITANMSTPALITFSVQYTQTQVGSGFTPTSFTWGASAIPNVPEVNFATLTFQ